MVTDLIQSARATMEIAASLSGLSSLPWSPRTSWEMVWEPTESPEAAVSWLRWPPHAPSVLQGPPSLQPPHPGHKAGV